MVEVPDQAGVPGATSGRHRRHGRNPASTAAAADSKKRTFRRFEVGEGQIPAVAAVLAAGREALVNAAKFSGETHLSTYCELAEDRFEVFVRDRGKGFELDTIPEDRRGIRDSVVGRMRSIGGSSSIRTGPGDGTEVQLSLPIGNGRG